MKYSLLDTFLIWLGPWWLLACVAASAAATFCFVVGFQCFQRSKRVREKELADWQVSSEEELRAKIHAIQKENKPSELQELPVFGKPIWSGAVKHYQIKARCKANSTRRRYSLSTLTPARRGTTL